MNPMNSLPPEVRALQDDVERGARHVGSLSALQEFVRFALDPKAQAEAGVRDALRDIPPDEATRCEAALHEALKEYPPEVQSTLVKRFLVRLTSTAPLEQNALGPDLEAVAANVGPEVRRVLAARLVNKSAVQGDAQIHFLSRHTEDEWSAAVRGYQRAIESGPNTERGTYQISLSPAALSPLRRTADPKKYQRPTYGKLGARARDEVDRLEHYMRTQIGIGQGDPVEMYLRAGAVWFECGFRERDDIDAFTAATRLLDEVDAGPANEVLRMSESLNLHQAMFCGRWFASGAPRVRLSAAQAASLMLTDLPRDFVDAELHQPWPAFIVDLPENLVPIGDGSDWAKRVLVHRVRMSNRDCLWWMMVQGNATGFSVGRRSLYDLQNEDELRGEAADDGGVVVVLGCLRTQTTRESFARFAAVAKLIAGICYKLQEKPPAPIRAQGGGAIRRRPGGPPQTTEIKLGFPVKVDFSNLVRGHLLGHVKRLAKVQWLVRGHWRNQVCGPQRAMRRMTWIEPFWKGPIDAPILVRDYIVKDREIAGGAS